MSAETISQEELVKSLKHREADKAYYQRNREKIIAKRRAYRKKYVKRVRKLGRIRYEKRKDIIRKRQNEARKADPEKWRKYHQDYYAKHKLKRRRQVRDYYDRKNGIYYEPPPKPIVVENPNIPF